MALIKNLFWELKKYIFFKITLYQEKSNLALVGQNLHSRKNLQKQISFIHAQVPRNELAPLNSKKMLLSPNPNIVVNGEPVESDLNRFWSTFSPLSRLTGCSVSSPW